MSNEVAAISEEYMWTTKWWAFGGRFPLIPQFRFKPENEHNTSGFHLHWLGLRAWSMDSPDIGFEISIDDQQACIRFRFPYLIIGWFQPVFPQRFMMKLWRRPPSVRDRKYSND